MSRRARHATRWALILALMVLGSCTRKTTLAENDSGESPAMETDSLRADLRQVQLAWEGALSDEDAAHLTARVLFQDLGRRDPAEWRNRTEDLLDSLGVGAETAGGTCALLVNLFLRADPARGSWPALYWCEDGEPRYQEVEGKGLRLLSMATQRPADTSGAVKLRRVAGLFGRTRAGRQEPLLYVWARRPGSSRWNVVQTLGSDSLGGYGTGEFEALTDTSADLVTRTYRIKRGFEECVTCEHAYRTHRFEWRGEDFVRLETQDVPSPYATFVRFITQLQDMAPDAGSSVTSPDLLELATRLEWDRTKGAWRIAPAAEEGGNELTLLRGAQEAYRVSFERRGDDWLISGIQTTERRVE